MYLDYASIRVRDLLRSLRFYARGLGLLEIRRGRTDGGGTWILLEDPTSRQRIQLDWYPPSAAHVEPWKSGVELDHLRVRVDDPEEVARRLTELGGKELARALRAPAGDTIQLEDPDGILIQLSPLSESLAPVPNA